MANAFVCPAPSWPLF